MNKNSRLILKAYIFGFAEYEDGTIRISFIPEGKNKNVIYSEYISKTDSQYVNAKKTKIGDKLVAINVDAENLIGEKLKIFRIFHFSPILRFIRRLKFLSNYLFIF